jgi:hypothetical protein
MSQLSSFVALLSLSVTSVAFIPMCVNLDMFALIYILKMYDFIHVRIIYFLIGRF